MRNHPSAPRWMQWTASIQALPLTIWLQQGSVLPSRYTTPQHGAGSQVMEVAGGLSGATAGIERCDLIQPWEASGRPLIS